MHQTQLPSLSPVARPGPLEIQRQVLLEGRRNNQCWFSPSIAAIPRGESGVQVVVNVHQLSGNDFGPIHTIHTQDQGRSWCPPFESQNLFKIPHENDIYESVHTLGLIYHRKSGRTIAHGGTAFSRDRSINPLFKTEWFVKEKVMSNAGFFAFWNPAGCDFSPWRRLDIPEIRSAGGCPLFFGLNQCCELDDGAILMPLGVYKADKTASVGTIKARIEADSLLIEQVGPQVGVNLYEPSMTRFDGRFFMTLRSEKRDGRMYHTAGEDGMNWSEPRAWRWDDGEAVETANTQQHWMQLGGELYLVYTRKSELNNGVYRHRAPLYLARVDAGGDEPRLVRRSEQVVFEEKGARMGNYAICRISENESWITTGEWMQQWIEGYRPEQPGWIDSGDDPSRYNLLLYRGDLLLAKVKA